MTLRSEVGVVQAESVPSRRVLIPEELSGGGRQAEVVDLDLVLPWRQIAQGEVELAQRVESLGDAANAQFANPDRGRPARDIRTRGQPREPSECAEPQRTVAIAEGGRRLRSGQSVGDSEALDLAALGLQSIDIALRARVDVAGPIVGQTPDGPAAESLGRTV